MSPPLQPAGEGQPRGGPLDRWVVTIGSTGIVLAIIQAEHVRLMWEYYGPAATVLEAVVPFSIAIAIVGSAVWLERAGYTLVERRRIVGWMGATAASVGLLFGWALSHQYLLGLPFPHAEFVMTTNLTAGALLGVVVGLYDVRSRRHRRAVAAEREVVNRQRVRLSVLNRVLRHNIRNEASVILGATETVARRTEGETRTLATRAVAKTEGLVALGEKARRLDRIADRDDAAVESIDIDQLLSELAETHANATPIEVDRPAAIERLTTDRELLGLVLTELIDNAVTHAPDTEEPVRLAVEDSPETIDFVVTDDGPGIPDHEVEILGAETETDLEHGSGLGLWLAQFATEELGGTLEFHTEGSGGTTARLRLPRPGATKGAASPSR